MSTLRSRSTNTVAYRDISPIAPPRSPNIIPIAARAHEELNHPVTAPRKTPANSQAPMPISIQTPKTSEPANHPPAQNMAPIPALRRDRSANPGTSPISSAPMASLQGLSSGATIKYEKTPASAPNMILMERFPKVHLPLREPRAFWLPVWDYATTTPHE